MENYLEVHNWMRGLGYPENIGEFTEMLKEDATDEEEFRKWEGLDEDWQEFNKKNSDEDDK